MSTILPSGEQAERPRLAEHEFWHDLERHYAGRDPERWKWLAIITLREVAGWPLERIGRVFGYTRGHLARQIGVILARMERQFGDGRGEPEACLCCDCAADDPAPCECVCRCGDAGEQDGASATLAFPTPEDPDDIARMRRAA